MTKLWKGGLAIDIDDTVCNTAGTCFARIADKFGTPAGETWETLQEKYAQPHRVEEWQKEEVLEWLKYYLNDSEFLLNLEPLPVAVEGLQRISQEVPIRLYLSSRLDTNQAVTEQWLEKHHLPKAPVVTRPDSVRSRHWKLDYLHKHHPEVWGLVDDDIEENLLLHTLYRGKLFMIGRKGAERSSVFQPQIVHLRGWEEFYRWILQEKAAN